MQTFKLIKGEITFARDKIIIVDDAEKQKWLTLTSSSMWTIFGIFSVLRYLKTGDQFLLWTGLIIGLGHLFIFVLTLFRTVQSEISLNDVKSVTARQRFKNKFLDIKLKNNRLRRVIRVDNSELIKYIEINFKTK
ncbi:hypothetical protein [Lacihabitans lacunae]|uniref:Uncharacterized protein n=1 Tax=Lacihabitans lacunae TaxID=1028214 RepID=A0ABV7YUV6_9BACT